MISRALLRVYGERQLTSKITNSNLMYKRLTPRDFPMEARKMIPSKTMRNGVKRIEPTTDTTVNNGAMIATELICHLLPFTIVCCTHTMTCCTVPSFFIFWCNDFRYNFQDLYFQLIIKEITKLNQIFSTLSINNVKTRNGLFFVR